MPTAFALGLLIMLQSRSISAVKGTASFSGHGRRHGKAPSQRTMEPTLQPDSTPAFPEPGKDTQAPALGSDLAEHHCQTFAGSKRLRLSDRQNRLLALKLFIYYQRINGP